MTIKISHALYALGFASIALSASRYLTSNSGDAERDGLFVGHWAPTFFILGKIAEDRERLSAAEAANAERGSEAL